MHALKDQTPDLRTRHTIIKGSDHNMPEGWTSRPYNDMQYRLIERGESPLGEYRPSNDNQRCANNAFPGKVRCPACSTAPCSCRISTLIKGIVPKKRTQPTQQEDMEWKWEW